MSTPDLSHIIERAHELDMPKDAVLLAIDAEDQRMRVVSGRKSIAEYLVSTSRHGLGEEFDSNKTPRGFHVVAARYGAGEPPGTRFISRKPNGQVLDPEEWHMGDDDKILTRILRLRGMEQGINAGKGVDSFERLIYIHGTNQEQHVGVTPSSEGCIRMKNRDVLELFDSTLERDVWCWVG